MFFGGFCRCVVVFYVLALNTQAKGAVLVLVCFEIGGHLDKAKTKASKLVAQCVLLLQCTGRLAFGETALCLADLRLIDSVHTSRQMWKS